MYSAPLLRMRKSDTIILPVTTPSLNKTLNMTWQKRIGYNKRLSAEYCLLIQSEMNKHKLKKTNPEQKFSLIVDSIRVKELDYDNHVGGCKLLVDCLIKQGFIFEDSPKFLKSHYQQSTLKSANRSEPQTIITRIYENN